MKIKIVGIGHDYTKNRDYIYKTFDVEGLFDNDNTKIGEVVDGYCVETASKLSKGDKCLVCSTQYKYILTNQLLSQGVNIDDIQYLKDECVRLLGGNFFASPQGVFFEIKDRLKVKFIDKTQENIFWEIFYEECYNFCSNEEMILIDIGLNAGFASLYFALKDNIKKIYGFEPDASLYSQAEYNISINPRLKEKIQIFPYALSNEDKIERFVPIENVSGGIRKYRKGIDQAERALEVQCVDSLGIIKDIIDNNRDRKVVIKSDCEGAEYDILNRLEQGDILDNIHVILMEWHMGQRKELEEWLKRNGYNYVIRNSTETFGLCYAYRNNYIGNN